MYVCISDLFPSFLFVVAKVCACIALCNDHANTIDSLLIVDGGSVIDSTKAISPSAPLLDCDIYDYLCRHHSPAKGDASLLLCSYPLCYRVLMRHRFSCF